MKLNYHLEKYEAWTNHNSIVFERRLVNETAFDGIVKIYSLQSDNSKINRLLKNHLFGDFIHYASNGIFLRQFDSKTSWPNTKLIYIDFDKFSLTEIEETNSSWNVWTGTDLGKGKHSIYISPTEKIEYQIQFNKL